MQKSEPQISNHHFSELRFLFSNLENFFGFLCKRNTGWTIGFSFQYCIKKSKNKFISTPFTLTKDFLLQILCPWSFEEIFFYKSTYLCLVFMPGEYWSLYKFWGRKRTWLYSSLYLTQFRSKATSWHYLIIPLRFEK